MAISLVSPFSLFRPVASFFFFRKHSTTSERRRDNPSPTVSTWSLYYQTTALLCAGRILPRQDFRFVDLGGREEIGSTAFFALGSCFQQTPTGPDPKAKSRNLGQLYAGASTYAHFPEDSLHLHGVRSLPALPAQPALPALPALPTSRYVAWCLHFCFRVFLRSCSYILCLLHAVARRFWAPVMYRQTSQAV